MDYDAVDQLGAIALGETLTELGISEEAIRGAQRELGGRGEKDGLSKETIYGGRYVDEDEDYDESELPGEEDIAADNARILAGGKREDTAVRGEESDYDEDEEEDGLFRGEDDDGAAETNGNAAHGKLALPQEEGPKSPEAIVEEPEAVKDIDIHQVFPSFREHEVLNFTDLFLAYPRKKPRTSVGNPLKLPAISSLPLQGTTKDVFNGGHAKRPAPILAKFSMEAAQQDVNAVKRLSLVEPFDEEGEKDEEEPFDKNVVAPEEDVTMQNPELDDWESRIVWGNENSPDSDSVETPASDAMDIDEETAAAANVPSTSPEDNILGLRSQDIWTGEWTYDILWQEPQFGMMPRFARVDLTSNDPELLVSRSNDSNQAGTSLSAMAQLSKVGRPHLPRSAVPPRDSRLDMLNLSHDRMYEISREKHKKAIRQTFGHLEVQHTWPAQKLQLPFYKTVMSKSDERSWHRTPLNIPPDVVIHFSKLFSKKKIKAQRADKLARQAAREQELGLATGAISPSAAASSSGSNTNAKDMITMGEISLKDTSPYVLWEYSEEFPPILSNVGMGSIQVNYYRKRDPADGFVPQLDIGEPFLLDVNDESPFMKFGNVEPGQTIPAIYNNLIRAPLFKHQPRKTDFLVVKVNKDGESTYYLRAIKNVYVVGQTYPLVEVPGPQSRKINLLNKYRLQLIAHNLVARDPRHRIKVHRLTRYFPGQNDPQMRQRLKEFMEFSRKGDNQGYWMMKRGANIPTVPELMKLATPEMVCLVESMYVGKRNLEDAGYGHLEEGGGGDDDSRLDVEQQLAPWITTKNFINATSNKAMLKLHGEGDPTGRGEAFSFLRASMKDIFLRAGEDLESRLKEMANRPKSAHRYNVQEQQDVYREEIDRIWKAQYRSLSDPKPAVLTTEDQVSYARRNPALRQVLHTDNGNGPASPAGGGTPGSQAKSTNAANVLSNMRRGNDKPNAPRQVLKIQRLVNGTWETETVKDPSVISNYVRQRQIVELQAMDAASFRPTDDQDRNTLQRQLVEEQLSQLKKTRDRRMQRRSLKERDPNNPNPDPSKRLVKHETSRVCSNCGQRGHMKTSRKLCPRWAEFNEKKSSDTIPNVSFAPTGLVPGVIPAVVNPVSQPAAPPAPSPAPAPAPAASPPPAAATPQSPSAPSAPKVRLSFSGLKQ